MPVPTNLTPATAIVFTSLPYSVTLDAFEVPNEDLWFRYDKVAGGYMVLLLAQPVPLLTGTYVPVLTAWVGPVDALVPYLDLSGQVVTIQPPLQGSIVSYYFRVRRAGGVGPFTEQLYLQADPGPVAAAPAGSIGVNDDQDGFPISIVDVTTGAVYQQFPMPAGERVAMLPSGVMLWHDEFNKRAEVRSPVFALVATVAWSVMADHAGHPECPMGASDTMFYLGDIGDLVVPRNAHVTTVSDTGVLGSTVWNLGSYFLWSMAPSRDDTILYYTQASNGAIKRWDLVGDAPLSDLVAGVSSYTSGKDLFVLADGSILTAYSGASPFVRRYSAAGATIQNYPLATSANRLTLSLNEDEPAFWVWRFIDGGITSEFTKIRLSDGVVLTTVESPVTSGGVWLGPSDGPNAGVSVSCPFVEIPPPGLPPITFEGEPEPEPEPEPSVPYETRTLDQRRLRRASHLSDEHRWLTYDRFQLDLQAGVGLTDGQGEDPQVMVRWSNDGGHTWSREQWRTAGRQGARKTRVIVRQTGRARVRTFEVVVSDPVAWYLAAAYLDVTPGDGN